MKITREPRNKPQDRLIVNLERDFSDKEEALTFLFNYNPFNHPDIVKELFNNSDPSIWIIFTIGHKLTILNISLS